MTCQVNLNARVNRSHFWVLGYNTCIIYIRNITHLCNTSKCSFAINNHEVYKKRNENPTAGHKAQSEIRTTQDMFVQLMVMQSSKYACVRGPLPTYQHYDYKFHVSGVNNVYFNFERHMGKWRHCVPEKVWKLWR